MHKIPFTDFHYQTEKRTGAVLFPSLVFYLRLFGIILRASRLARNKCYDGSDWMESSYEVMERLESVGVSIEISGIKNIEK